MSRFSRPLTFESLEFRKVLSADGLLTTHPTSEELTQQPTVIVLADDSGTISISVASEDQDADEADGTPDTDDELATDELATEEEEEELSDGTIAISTLPDDQDSSAMDDSTDTEDELTDDLEMDAPEVDSDATGPSIESVNDDSDEVYDSGTLPISVLTADLESDDDGAWPANDQLEIPDECDAENAGGVVIEVIAPESETGSEDETIAVNIGLENGEVGDTGAPGPLQNETLADDQGLEVNDGLAIASEEEAGASISNDASDDCDADEEMNELEDDVAVTVPTGNEETGATDESSEPNVEATNSGVGALPFDEVAIAETEAVEGMNDTKVSAQQILLQLGYTVDLTGKITRNKRDFFLFRADKSGQLSVKAESSSGRSPNIQIQDQLGNEVVKLEPGGGASREATEIVAGRSYFVRVLGTTDETEDYLVQLHSTSIESSTTTPADQPVSLSLLAMDTNGDELISPQDVLLVVNVLNRMGVGEPVGDLLQMVSDINKDDHISPIDALVLINHLNRINASQQVTATATISPEAMPQTTASADANSSPASINDIVLAEYLLDGDP